SPINKSQISYINVDENISKFKFFNIYFIYIFLNS
ncbi:unnamed protein product, partial [marine sediment metagenome]